MKKIFFLVFILSVTTAASQDFKNYYRKKDSTIQDIQVFKGKHDPSVTAVIYVWEKDWWEGLSVLKIQTDKILWEATFDSLQGEQSIRSVKQLKLKGFNNIFYQVYGQTHMGNGFYYLCELKERQLILRATTRALDLGQNANFSLEGSGYFYSRIFRHDTLTATYKDINSDGIADIELEGIIQIIDDNYNVVKSYPCRKVLVYSKKRNRFIEDRKKRVGFKKDDD